MRSSVGGGSVARDLLRGERLTDLQVEGAAATGIRRNGADAQPVEFRRRRDGWRIKILVRR